MAGNVRPERKRERGPTDVSLVLLRNLLLRLSLSTAFFLCFHFCVVPFLILEPAGSPARPPILLGRRRFLSSRFHFCLGIFDTAGARETRRKRAMAPQAFGGFSIREYAAGMRKADAIKCWPFGGDVRESLLPPIECRRCRWWSSELQINRSAEGMEQERNVVDCDGGQKVCGGEPSRSARDAEVVSPLGDLANPWKMSTVEEDGEGQARSSEKPNARTPKKRSIKGLFALAPQVDVPGEEEKDDNSKAAIEEIYAAKEDGHGEGSDWCSVEEQMKGKKECTKRRMRRTKGNCVKKTKARVKKMANKKRGFHPKQHKRKESFADGLTKEEKICKSLKRSPGDVPQLPCDSTGTDVSGKAKNTEPSFLQKDKSEKENRVPETEECITPRNLHNHQTDASLALVKTRTTDPARRPEEKVDIRRGKGITGHGIKQVSSTLGSPHMRSLCRVFSDVLTSASVAHNSSESKYPAVTKKINGKEVRASVLSKKSVDVPDVTNPEDSSHSKRSNPFHTVDLNSPADNCNSPVQTLHELSKVSTAEQHASIQEETISPNVSHRVEAILNGRCPQSTPAIGFPSPPLVRRSRSELASSSAMRKKRKQNPQDSLDVDAHSCFPTEAMLSTIYQSWLTRELPQKERARRATYSERSLNGDIVTGLPLNFQGELIHIHSGMHEGSKQLLKKKNQTSGHPAHRLPVHSFFESLSPDLRNQRNSQTQINHDSERKYGEMTGNLNALDFPGTDSFRNRNEPGLPAQARQPTMRLMGTNITLARSNEQRGSDGVKAWVDQNSISVNDPNLGTRREFLRRGSRPKGVTDMSSCHHPFETQEEPSTSKSYRLDVDPCFDPPLFGGERSNVICGKRRHPVHFIQPHAPKAWLRNEAIEMGVVAPVGMHQNWKKIDRLPNPSNHLQFPSAQLPSPDFAHWQMKEGNRRSSDVHLPGFPLSSSIQSPDNLYFQSVPYFASLTAFDSVDETRENSSPSGWCDLLKPTTMGEQPQANVKNAVNKTFEVNDAAREGLFWRMPVKLSAGAKHIFRPYLKMQD